MGKPANDIQDLEDEIKQIEKEYGLLLSRVSRSPIHMTTSAFMDLDDIDRIQLINEEVRLYCERDNKVRDLRDKQNDIRLLNKDMYKEKT
jgi:uncharacterized transporter YbjL